MVANLDILGKDKTHQALNPVIQRVTNEASVVLGKKCVVTMSNGMDSFESLITGF